jgi:hypothetical protein
MWESLKNLRKKKRKKLRFAHTLLDDTAKQRVHKATGYPPSLLLCENMTPLICCLPAL